MCGIIGVASKRNVASILLNGLKKLEYRGYDSSGMAIISPAHDVQLVRTVGKVGNLEVAISASDLKGGVGIAHTRWATHGEPSEINAHPQMSGDLAVVHNGIIENHAEIRVKLKKSGYTFHSDTDTEVIAHLIHKYESEGNNLLQSLQQASKELEGAYAVGVVSKTTPNEVVVVRKGSPLVIGIGIDENFIASDSLALLSHAGKLIYLEDGDSAVVSIENVQLFDLNGKKVVRNIQDVNEKDLGDAQKGEFNHFMLKEIFEQPIAIKETLEGRFNNGQVVRESFGYEAEKIFDSTKNVLIVACGTSYHAGLVAKYWIESIAKIPTSVEIASEFRYRETAINPGTLFVTISQSGETADTISALKKAKKMDFLKCLSICNVANSTLIREADFYILTRAGREIGVASTKAFTTQLVILLLLAQALDKNNKGNNNKISDQEWVDLLNSIDNVLDQMDDIKDLARCFLDKKSALFLGRGALYPIAQEGALKLKEISYIHAESYAAGELKHGPLALVDQHMPVVVVAPNDEMLKKVKSNLNEVHARRGTLFVFTDNHTMIDGSGIHVIKMPTINLLLTPILYTVSLQLLAYYVAVGKGTDIDQPRNLAKSVTVE